MNAHIEEPKGLVMQALLLAAVKRTDRLLLRGATRDVDLNAAPWTGALAALVPFVTARRETKIWPGTPGGPRSGVVEIAYNQQVAKTMFKIAQAWFDFSCPKGLLEDMAFLRAGKPWLITVTHERMIWLDMQEDEVSRLLKDVAGLQIEVDPYTLVRGQRSLAKKKKHQKRK
jgi:hypothetical protein